MKAGIFSLGAIALCQIVAAQPHGALRHAHLHHARDQIAARDTGKIKEVLVYVDGHGNTIRTEERIVDAPSAAPAAKPAVVPAAAPAPAPAAKVVQPAAAPAPAAVPAAAPVAAKVQVQQRPSPEPKPAPAPAPPSDPAPSDPAPAPKPPVTGNGFGLGVSYAPYQQQASGGCKDATAIAKDVALFGDFDLIRIYGTDCDQVNGVLQAIKGSDKKVFAGIYDVNNWQKEADIIIAAVKANGGSWDAIHTISIGNEVVNGGGSVSAVTGAVNAGRTYLRGAGYTGPVTTVDTFNAMDANPELYEASDYVTMNCHAFFDPNTPATGAGDFVASWVKKIGAKANGKTVAITESGWPTGGNPNGLAHPGTQQQSDAMKSLKAAVPNNIVLYSAFNNYWLQDNAGTYCAEHFWGMLNGGVAPGN